MLCLLVVCGFYLIKYIYDHKKDKDLEESYSDLPRPFLEFFNSDSKGVRMTSQHLFATRVCTHEERLRHLRKYCRGKGRKIAEKYKKELENPEIYVSTVVSCNCTNRCLYT